MKLKYFPKTYSFFLVVVGVVSILFLKVSIFVYVVLYMFPICFLHLFIVSYIDYVNRTVWHKD